MNKVLSFILGSVIGILVLMNCYTYHKYEDALKNRAYIDVVGFTRGYNSAILDSLEYMLEKGYITEDQYAATFDEITSKNNKE